MCAGLIHDAGGGKVKAFYGQEDTGKLASTTELDRKKMGYALDAHKGSILPYGIVVGKGTDKKALGKTLLTRFEKQQKGGIGSPIDYIVDPAVSDLMVGTEKMLTGKIAKYKEKDLESTDVNPNTKRAIDYLAKFLALLSLQPDSLAKY